MVSALGFRFEKSDLVPWSGLDIIGNYAMLFNRYTLLSQCLYPHSTGV